jgi:hypothetical protein
VCAASGCAGAGVDIAPQCLALAARVAASDILPSGTRERLAWHCRDATTVLPPPGDGGGSGDGLASVFACADVIFLYCYPTLIVALEPLIAACARRGARIVTATFHFDDVRWRTNAANDEADVRLVELIPTSKPS